MCENLTSLLGNTSSSCDIDNATTSNTSSENKAKDDSEYVVAFYQNVLTVAFHVVAFMFIVFPASVKPSLRIFLLSLSVPGFMQNMAWSVARGLTLTSGHDMVGHDVGCKCLTFFTQLGILCGQTTVTGLAVNNYLAVSYPILFKQWITPFKTFIAILSIWTFWTVYSVLDTFTREDSKKPCLPLVVSPIFLLMTEALVILLSSLIVAALNIAVIFKLKRQFKIRPVSNDQGLKDDTSATNDTRTEYLNRHSVPSQTPAGNSIFTIAEEGTDLARKGSQATNGRTQAFEASISSGQTLSVPTFPRRLWNKKTGRRRVSPATASSNSVGPEPDSTSYSQVEPTVPESSAQDSSLVRRSRTNPRRVRRSKVHSTAVTLIILSVWNSLGQLPFMVCILVAVANRGTAPSASITALNSASGLIARLATIGNTFIYAWRFIKWRSVFDRLRRSKILRVFR